MERKRASWDAEPWLRAGERAAKVIVFHLPVLIIAAILIFGAAAPPKAHYGHHGKALLPDPHVTPGAVRTTDTASLCAPSFRTGKYRSTTEATKKAACAEYGVADCPHAGKLEIDHLISLEIGGADTLENLWPEPADPEPGFHTKDKVENALHSEMCAGKMTAAQAQACIRGDWVACGEKLGILNASGKYIGKAER